MYREGRSFVLAKRATEAEWCFVTGSAGRERGTPALEHHRLSENVHYGWRTFG